MSTREILLEAADVIETNGHFKGDFLDFDEVERILDAEGVDVDTSTCAVCAYGAINIAACGQPDYGTEAGESAAHAFAAFLGITPSAIGIWNDAPERTMADVVTALRECAEGVAA